eukprot:1161900-Pelagomonas_calceolata.AAC.9
MAAAVSGMHVFASDNFRRYHTVEEDIRKEALSLFFPPEAEPRVAPTTGGVGAPDKGTAWKGCAMPVNWCSLMDGRPMASGRRVDLIIKSYDS